MHLVRRRREQRRLAGDWTEMQDEDTGTVYYVNKHTGESQWGKPDGFDGQWLFEADTAAMVARSRLRKNAGLEAPKSIKPKTAEGHGSTLTLEQKVDLLINANEDARGERERMEGGGTHVDRLGDRPRAVVPGAGAVPARALVEGEA